MDLGNPIRPTRLAYPPAALEYQLPLAGPGWGAQVSVVRGPPPFSLLLSICQLLRTIRFASLAILGAPDFARQGKRANFAIHLVGVAGKDPSRARRERLSAQGRRIVLVLQRVRFAVVPLAVVHVWIGPQ